MGTKQSCISPTGTEPRNTARTNVSHSSPSPVNEKMGAKQSYKFTKPKVEPNDTAKTSPVQSQQVRDPVYPTGSNFQVPPKTDEEVKRSKPIGRDMVVHTFDGKSEDVSGDLHERPVTRSNITLFEMPCPRHALDLTNEDQKKKSKRIENTIFPPVETRDTGDIKTAERNENHDASSTNNMNTVYVYERNVKRLESRAGQFSAENDGLINRKTNDQTELFSQQEMKDGSTLTARGEHFPSQKMEAPGNAWLEDSSGLENRKTNDQTELFSQQEMKDGQPLDRKYEDHKKKSKKKKRKIEKTGKAKDHNAAERNENQDESSSYDVKRLETLVSQLRQEKVGLLNRLSEIGAIRLTENNPNVTDLGDANRPEKLLEQLSELYDNEWTDAYEYLTKTRNESMEWSVNQLLQILQETFNFCFLSTEKKTETLRNAITDYVGLTKQEQDEIEFKDVEKKLREYRMIKLQNNFKRTEQEVGDQLKGICTKETFENVSEYIGTCIRICFKMCIKEPPMYLDFGDSKEPAQSNNKTATKMHFDKAKFLSYTKSGNFIDYVVWPAVYLYKDGPLMKKGVAQGT